MFRNLVSVAALWALLVASTAFAQGRGGRGGRGQGGPGGQGGMRASATMLLAMPEVQTELSLTDDEKKQIQTVSDDVRQQFRQGAQGGQGGQGGFQNFRNMSQEERTKAMADGQARFEKIAKETDDKLSKILTPEQSTRLKQLQVQYEGVNALTTNDIVTKLKVTDDQKTKIQKVIDDARAQRGQGGGFNRNATDAERQAAAKARRDARAKTLKDAQAVLDDDQLVQWGEMRGKDFKFPDNMGGGRGQRGGRGTRGGGGNGGGGNNGGGTTPGAGN